MNGTPSTASLKPFWPRLGPMLTLLACALVLTACNGRTGVVRANLETPSLKALGDTVKQRCSVIPRVWPADVDTQEEVERYVKRDQADTESCANPAIRYVDRIRARDKELQKAVKK